MRVLRAALWIMAALAGLAAPAAAAGIDGRVLGPAWAIPFAGMLLSIALMPLLAGAVWHHHYGKISAGWAALVLVPAAIAYGPGVAAVELRHVALTEYIPFMALLLALYVTGGGVLLRGTLVGTPATNTALLAIGTALASVMGTTGASIVMIRPLLRANAFRRRKTHSFVFFIFLVSNIGGALTPLGDPPLYLGFLRGVSFFWTTSHLLPETLFCVVLLLALYYALDSWVWARERPRLPDAGPRQRLRIAGRRNLWLIGIVLGTVLAQGYWRPGHMHVLGEPVAIERVLGVLVFLAVAWISLRATPTVLREENGFAWGAMAEVAKLFAAIFVTMAPVLAMLRAGPEGAAADLVALTSDAAGQPIPWVYFWLTGLLSSFLDNAPTYLVFFNLAGGDAHQLMGEGAQVLAAISCGAVFMGANSYIGNAPNFMVKAIVEENGSRMPSFFGFCAWAAVVLLPVFVLVTVLFF